MSLLILRKLLLLVYKFLGEKQRLQSTLKKIPLCYNDRRILLTLWCRWSDICFATYMIEYHKQLIGKFKCYRIPWVRVNWVYLTTSVSMRRSLRANNTVRIVCITLSHVSSNNRNTTLWGGAKNPHPIPFLPFALTDNIIMVLFFTSHSTSTFYIVRCACATRCESTRFSSGRILVYWWEIGRIHFKCYHFLVSGYFES